MKNWNKRLRTSYQPVAANFNVINTDKSPFYDHFLQYIFFIFMLYVVYFISKIFYFNLANLHQFQFKVLLYFSLLSDSFSLSLKKVKILHIHSRGVSFVPNLILCGQISSSVHIFRSPCIIQHFQQKQSNLLF